MTLAEPVARHDDAIWSGIGSLNGMKELVVRVTCPAQLALDVVQVTVARLNPDTRRLRGRVSRCRDMVRTQETRTESQSAHRTSACKR